MRSLDILAAKAGMIAAKDIYNSDGKVLIAKGVKLTERYLSRLKDFHIEQIEVHDEPERVGETIGLALDAVTLTREELELLVNRSIRRLIKTNAKKQDLMLLVEDIFEEILRDNALLNVMFKIKVVGDQTFFHAVQVAVLSVATGLQLELGKPALVQLGKAALMYDVGKCFLTRDLLHCSDAYDARQTMIMREHTISGYMLLKMEFAEEIALPALQHHERFDGSGYPRQSSNDDIHLYSRIISVADVYMALKSYRSYRAAYQPYEAIEYILGAGGYLFDSRVVNAFNEIVIIYALGSVVQLNDGRAGLVTGITTTYSQRPEITLMFDKQMMPIASEMIDLTSHSTAFITRVLHE